MVAKTTKPVAKPRLDFGGNVPMRVIRRYARQVAERFQPDRIILFGSYAYGTPHAESDVDLMVVMPCRNSGDMAFKIRCTIDPPFAVHVVVRTPYAMEWRLREGDSFSTEISTKGKVLYAKSDPGVGEKSRVRSPRRRRMAFGGGTV